MKLINVTIAVCLLLTTLKIIGSPAFNRLLNGDTQASLSVLVMVLVTVIACVKIWADSSSRSKHDSYLGDAGRDSNKEDRQK